MSNTAQFILILIAMFAALLISRRFALMKMRRAFQYIIDDLRRQNALTPESAVTLSYSRRQLIKFGLRDYRPKVLTQMIAMNIVGIGDEQKLFLNEEVLAEMNTPKSETEEEPDEISTEREAE